MPADLYCRDIHIASWYMAKSVSSLSWGCSVWVENIHLFFRIWEQLQESEDEAMLFLLKFFALRWNKSLLDPWLKRPL